MDMTDETQVQIPQPAEAPQAQPDIIPPAPRSSSKIPWIVAGLIGILVCFCCAVCLALVALAVGKVFLEKAPVEAVLKSFMTDMKARDAHSAYDLFSPRSKRTTPLKNLEQMLQGNNYILFDGYEDLSVQNLNISAAVNTNPDMPQGTVANVDGTISYANGVTGSFTAVLEKVDGQWKLFNINITFPPEELNL
jgi:hypothetical protein